MKSWEKTWDENAEEASQNKPLKRLKHLPKIPGVKEPRLRSKALKYMVVHDEKRKITRHFLKHPLKYGKGYLKSLFKKESYVRDDDFFYYGLDSTEAFKQELAQENAKLVVGFSYCQKPFECPSERFTDKCDFDPNHPVCAQCDIGKVRYAVESCDLDYQLLLIPTIHYIGDQIFSLVHQYPEKKILFVITACEMTLKMFADYGNMVGVKGIGVRLDGRICNTMRAFELSERGIKPGLTVVTSETQRRLLDLIPG